MIEEPFWMICRKPEHRNSKTEPKARYSHRDAAENDARRMSAQTNTDFVILEAVKVVRPTDERTKSFNY
jgi:hypothetical protein